MISHVVRVMSKIFICLINQILQPQQILMYKDPTPHPATYPTTHPTTHTHTHHPNDRISDLGNASRSGEVSPQHIRFEGTIVTVEILLRQRARHVGHGKGGQLRLHGVHDGCVPRVSREVDRLALVKVGCVDVRMHGGEVKVRVRMHGGGGGGKCVGGGSEDVWWWGEGEVQVRVRVRVGVRMRGGAVKVGVTMHGG